jgi:hypothetical protein
MVGSCEVRKASCKAFVRRDKTLTKLKCVHKEIILHLFLINLPRIIVQPPEVFSD